MSITANKVVQELESSAFYAFQEVLAEAKEAGDMSIFLELPEWGQAKRNQAFVKAVRRAITTLEKYL